MPRFQNLAPNLWFLSYPLTMLGADLQRNVTLIRLASGKLILHSTAPFTPEDIAAIRALGEPGWLVDSLLRHDTFAVQGHAAFPGIRYLAPAGFSKDLPFSTDPLLPPPAEWADEIAVAAIDGAPEFGEVVMLHRPSRTFIVADLVFHFEGAQNLWTRFLLKLATVGGKHNPGVTKPFKAAIQDPAAFQASLRTVLAWDFDRIIVGHGTPLLTGGKAKLRTALAEAGVITS